MYMKGTKQYSPKWGISVTSTTLQGTHLYILKYLTHACHMLGARLKCAERMDTNKGQAQDDYLQISY